MADNLLEMLKSQVGDAALGQLSQYLGVGQEQAGSALEKAGAVLLGGMLQKASSPSGLGDLFNMIQKQAGSGIPDLGSILGSPEKRDEYVRGGEDVLSSILGGQLPALLNALGPVLGVAGNLIKPLLSMLAPLLMGLISKQLSGHGGFNAQGLLNLLSSQKDHIQAALPASLAPALGLASLSDLGKSAASQAADAARSAAQYGAEAAHAASQAAAEGTSLLNTLLPLIGLALLALLGLFALRQCAPPEEVPVEPAIKTDADRETVLQRETDGKPLRPESDPNRPVPLPGPDEAVQDPANAADAAIKNAAEATTDALEKTGRAVQDAAEDAAKAVEPNP
ncbi:MAG: hypothetical protein KatS3mg108_3848 [Isosphaeraceae bacterium]|jgi:hypothetical protein|nr:MAG: hypothetical protein KatS3mg108_3848 [Isosphaeraceae bacterium]